MNWKFWRRQPYYRAVHYFGRTQPVNFWDAAALDDAPAHLEQIRRDGFDAVILVIPWRGFQLTMVPPTYDQQNLARLRTLLAMVQASGLRIILRISYPWNNNPGSVGSWDERILGLFTRNDVRQAWLDYLREIRRIAEAFDAFAFAFFSWEDLPSIREMMSQRSESERLALAKSTGFQEYIATRFKLPEVSRRYGRSFASYEEVFIPRPDCEAYRTYHEYVDILLGSLLQHGRAAWPRLSMQLRIDFDRLPIGDELHWIESDMRLGDFGLRVTYFFPFMYAQCHGETLSAAEVLVNLEKMLRRVSADGANTRHFIDQFVFHDESPHFQTWARVRESEMGEYLLGAARLLHRFSQGFAFWNYYDYRVNHFHNAAFIRGLEGWAPRGAVTLGTGAEPIYATLPPGAAIVQPMDPHAVGYATTLYETMRFAATVRAPAGGKLRVMANGVTEAELEIAAKAEPQTLEAAFPADRHRDGHVEVVIENTGAHAMEVTDLYLWGFVYRSRIRDEAGHPGRYLDAVHAMLRVEPDR